MTSAWGLLFLQGKLSNASALRKKSFRGFFTHNTYWGKLRFSGAYAFGVYIQYIFSSWGNYNYWIVFGMFLDWCQFNALFFCVFLWLWINISSHIMSICAPSWDIFSKSSGYWGSFWSSWVINSTGGLFSTVTLGASVFNS